MTGVTILTSLLSIAPVVYMNVSEIGLDRYLASDDFNTAVSIVIYALVAALSAAGTVIVRLRKNGISEAQ